MSSFIKNLALATVFGMASAIQIQAGASNIFKDDRVIFTGCDQSYFHPGGVYSMRLQCNKQFVINKHENGQVIDLKQFEINHDGEIGFMIMQSDGNLVVYSNDVEAMWNTETSGHPQAYLNFQDDGNLVIYKENGGAIWSSRTARQEQRYEYIWKNDAKIIDGCDKSVYHYLGGQYELRLQCNKELVLKKVEWGFTHVIKTINLDQAGPDAIVDHLVMQSDGNMVVYSTDHEVMWTTHTPNNVGAHFKMQDDGNLVIYDSAGSAIWNSNTQEIDQVYDRPFLWNHRSDPDKNRLSIRQVQYKELFSYDEDPFGRDIDNQLEIRAMELKLLEDGNVVLERQSYCQAPDNCEGSDKIVWSTETQGKGKDKILWLLKDGQLSLKTVDGKEIWSNYAAGKGEAPFKAVMANPGFFKVEDKNGQAVWAADQTQSFCLNHYLLRDGAVSTKDFEVRVKQCTEKAEYNPDYKTYIMDYGYMVNDENMTLYKDEYLLNFDRRI